MICQFIRELAAYVVFRILMTGFDEEIGLCNSAFCIRSFQLMICIGSTLSWLPNQVTASLNHFPNSKSNLDWKLSESDGFQSMV